MMVENKTKPDETDIADFLANVPPPRADEARQLVQIFSEVSGFAPRIWAGSMVGFGRYEYRYASGHSGQAMATGFSPRKADLSIYIMPGYADFSDILAGLGKHRLGKSCLYLRRLTDADQGALRQLIRAGLDDLAKQWPILPY